MVDRIQKILNNLNEKEKKQIKIILNGLKSGNFEHFDVKKLKGRDDIYRVRKGKIRIIYRVDGKKEILLLAIERRSETTYNFL